jgi:hypothetical protein
MCIDTYTNLHVVSYNSMSRSTFLCQSSDFAVRSLCDGAVFHVSKTAMQTSDVFSERPSIRL